MSLDHVLWSSRRILCISNILPENCNVTLERCLYENVFLTLLLAVAHFSTCKLRLCQGKPLISVDVFKRELYSS